MYPSLNEDFYPAWSEKLVAGGLEGISQSDKVEMLNGMFASARSGNMQTIDDFLKNAPVETLAVSSLITLVRGTFSFRNSLASWPGFRDAMSTELQKRGESPEKVMVGLSD